MPLADLRQENADAAARVLADAGFETSTPTVDVSDRASVLALVEQATGLGEVTGLVHAAGVSPSQASPEQILRVDLYGMTGSDVLVDAAATAAWFYGEDAV